MSDKPDTSENGDTQNLFDFDRSKGDFSFPERHKFDAGYGLTEATIDYICDVKDDPEWVRRFRASGAFSIGIAATRFCSCAMTKLPKACSTTTQAVSA